MEPDAIAQEHLQTLRDRERYLGARVKAKQSVGWEYIYDERERSALAWVIRAIEQELNNDLELGA